MEEKCGAKRRIGRRSKEEKEVKEWRRRIGKQAKKEEKEGQKTCISVMGNHGKHESTQAGGGLGKETMPTHCSKSFKLKTWNVHSTQKYTEKDNRFVVAHGWRLWSKMRGDC